MPCPSSCSGRVGTSTPVYRLDEAAAAHERLEAGDRFGKLVLRP